MSWIARVAKNILHLSESDDVGEALKEWYYTGSTYDLEEACETCALCDHPDIRYQFEIRNENTGFELLIGSECIIKFGISAVDDTTGKRLSQSETEQKVSRDRSKLITDAKMKRLINALVELASVDEMVEKHFISYLQDRGAFTPK